ncbi:MAG: T9SS type A sorting domain-containing protein [candidate division WOR-3 bacterium]|nr:T9SS type A sorting domain-containing protein [candidate division WOR-3 bacterium]
MRDKIMLLLLVLALPALAQWQPDQRQTNNAATSLATNNNTWGVAANGNTVHVVWYDNRDGNYELYYKRSTDAGVSWGSDVRLTTDAGASYYPAVAVRGDTVHVVWQDNRDGNYEIYYKRSTNAGASWGSDTRLTTDAGTSQYPCVAVSGDKVWVVWDDNRSPGNYNVYWKLSTDRGTNWGADTRLSTGTGSSILPSVVVLGNLVDVVWQDTRSYNNAPSCDLYYNHSTDNGATWFSGDLLLSHADGHCSRGPCIAASGTNVYVAFQSNRTGGVWNIWNKLSTDSGASFGADILFTINSATTFMPSLAASGAQVYEVWSDNSAGNYEIHYNRSTDNGTTWGGDTRLTNAAGLSQYPSVAVGGNAVHVVWTDTRDGNYEIYFKRDPTGNAVIDPVISPNGGETWYVGTVDSITWDQTNAVLDSIFYSTDGGTTWNFVAKESTSLNLVKYAWTVPSTPTTNALVKIVAYNASGGRNEDVSDAVFTIGAATVTVTAPNGGEYWYVGTVHNITWTETDGVKDSIYYSTDAGATWIGVHYDATTPSPLQYAWTVPNAPTTRALVKVVTWDPLGDRVEDVSDAVFTIGVYHLTVNSVHGTTGGAGWYEPGTTAYATVAPLIVDGGTGIQYVFTGWTGDATGSGSPSDPIIMNSDKTATAVWKTQYYLTVVSDHGTVGGTGWYDAGTNGNPTVTPTTVAGDPGVQYVFTGWTWSPSGPTMNAPTTATATWQTQYYLTVTSAHGNPQGEGWYDANTSAYGSVTTPDVNGGTRYVFTNWSGDATGSDNPVTVNMSGPKTITAGWQTQYYLTVDNGGHGTAGGAGWYDAGTTANATIDPLTVAGDPGVQYVFNGWTGDASGSGSPSNNITMNGPKTATATWKTQYQVTFVQSGLSSDAVGTVVTVTVGGQTVYEDYAHLPYTTGWIDAGQPVTYSYTSPVPVDASKRYVLTTPAPSPASPFNVTGVTTVTGTYKIEYSLNPWGGSMLTQGYWKNHPYYDKKHPDAPYIEEFLPVTIAGVTVSTVPQALAIFTPPKPMTSWKMFLIQFLAAKLNAGWQTNPSLLNAWYNYPGGDYPFDNQQVSAIFQVADGYRAGTPGGTLDTMKTVLDNMNNYTDGQNRCLWTAPWPSGQGPQDAGVTAVPTKLNLSVAPSIVKSGLARIAYSLPKAAPVQLTVLDITGRTVMTQGLPAVIGTHVISLDTRSWNAGVYFVKLTTCDNVLQKKLVVMR